MPEATPQQRPQAVAEVQGLFGPVSISEIVFQKIWKRGDFRTNDLHTLAGETLEIVSRGTWNRLGGPDFLGAEFIIGGRRVRGDVEFHFYAEDWFGHGHDKSSAYANVVLHVVLFPPRGKIPTKNAGGNAMETFLLLPQLTVDIEEYASNEALAALEGRSDGDSALELLLSMPLRERELFLVKNARERFAQKIRFMRRRLEKSTWEKTLHEIMLETLGLHRNRAAMSRLALKFSPSAMLLAGAETLFKSASGEWTLSGVRPANHPLARLRQYLLLLEKNPSWPRRLLDALGALPVSFDTENAGGGDGESAGTASVAEASGTAGTNASEASETVSGDEFSLAGRAFRSMKKLHALEKFFRQEIFADAVGGSRFETLMCDAVFPLAAVERADADLFPLWYHWFIGDAPAKVAKILRDAELVSRERPVCNGAFQGLLQILLTQASA